MNTDTGEIITPEQHKALLEDKSPEAKKEARKYVPVIIPLTPEQLKNMRVKKHDPCPCGSGKLFKFCCYTGNRSRSRRRGMKNEG